MKKIILGIALIGAIAFTELVAQLQAETTTVGTTEEFSCSLKGKHREYKGSEEFIKILEKHTKLVNAKFDFLKHVPQFLKYEIHDDESNWYGTKYVIFEVYDNSKDDIHKEKKSFDMYRSDALDILKLKNYTKEEWEDFAAFLQDIAKSKIFLPKNIGDTPIDAFIEQVRKSAEKRRIASKKANYTHHDLLEYIGRVPESTLPDKDTEIYISPHVFKVFDATIDGSGMDYLVGSSGNSRCIYIYGENLTVNPFGTLDTIRENPMMEAIIILRYTGMECPAVIGGNKVDVPVFIAK